MRKWLAATLAVVITLLAIAAATPHV